MRPKSLPEDTVYRDGYLRQRKNAHALPTLESLFGCVLVIVRVGVAFNHLFLPVTVCNGDPDFGNARPPITRQFLLPNIDQGRLAHLDNNQDICYPSNS